MPKKKIPEWEEERNKKVIENRKIFGLVLIIIGIFLSLSIIFIPLGVPLIIVGVVLRSYKKVEGNNAWAYDFAANQKLIREKLEKEKRKN